MCEYCGCRGVPPIAELMDEHTALAGLDAHAPEFRRTLTRLLDDLDQHVEREDLGIFPVSVLTIGATGWAMVDEAHSSSPSFLHDRDVTGAAPFVHP